MIPRSYYIYISLVLLNTFGSNRIQAIRKYSQQDLMKLREEVREMFDHAYTGYLRYAYPYDELRPLTCDGVDTWGSYSLTLIDALDTLAVMGNFSEFRRVVDIVTTKANFDANINVSVFETNIRIVGGLLSAHLLSQKAGIDLEPGWPCNGPLLRLAEDVAKRLLAAFNTKTGMPYGTVNLRHGVPPGETSVTCTAGVGTFILEFATLSRLTGDPVYEEVALNALKVMYEHRSSIGLFGNHIDVKTGKWIARDSGIGAGVDSFFEYLVKGSILLGRPDLMAMFNEVRRPIEKYLRKNNWYVWASMHKGQVTLPVFQSLEAYWPGVLTLVGDVESALRSMHNYNSVWKQYGFTPEFYNIAQGQAGTNRESYPLRPELAESAMYLYRATADPFMLDIGLNILRSIQHSAKTPCGYATIKDARDHSQENRMESFFLAETTKYLYLLFDPDNFIHNRGSHGQVHTLPSGKQCILDSGGYVFNTEAHPIDIGALHCCHDWTQNTFSSYKDFNFKGEKIDDIAGKPPVSRFETPEDQEVFQFEVEEEIDFNGEENGDPTVSPPNVIHGTVEKIKNDWTDEEAPEDEEPPEEKANNDERNETKKSGSEEDLTHVLDILQSNRKIIEEVLQKLTVDTKEEMGSTRQMSAPDSTEDPEGESLKPNDEPMFHGGDDGFPVENASSGPLLSDSSNLSFHNDEDVVIHDEAGDEKIGKSGMMTLSDYVRTIVVAASPASNFDPQQLLQTVRENKLGNSTWDSQYQLLSCKAQPFLIRITIAGEFLSEK